MRSFTGWTFALAVLALGTVTARAADKLVPEDGAIEVMLLRQASVREDLKLSHDEAAKINKFTSQQWKKAQEVSKLPPAERDKKFAEMTKENDRFIDQTVTKEQRKRLQEIELQTAGLICLGRHEIAAKLKLSDEQKRRVQGMQKEGRQEMEDLLYATDAEARQEKLTELRRTSRARILELLTEEQERIWSQLQGKPFKGKIEFSPTTTAAK